MVFISQCKPWLMWCLITVCSGAAGWLLGAQSRISSVDQGAAANIAGRSGTKFPWVSAEPIYAQGADAKASQAPALHTDGSHLRASALGAALEPVCAAPGSVKSGAAPDLSKVMRGTDDERYQALVAVQNEGGVTEAALKALYESDASPQVRLLAFDLALQAHAGNAVAMRDALQSARLMPDPAISLEAAKRLEALAVLEKAHAAAPQAQSQN